MQLDGSGARKLALVHNDDAFAGLLVPERLAAHDVFLNVGLEACHVWQLVVCSWDAADATTWYIIAHLRNLPDLLLKLEKLEAGLVAD